MKINDFINIAIPQNNTLQKLLINELPDIRLYELTSNLIIETNKYRYLIKFRSTIYNIDGTMDIESTNNNIKTLDFKQLSKKSYQDVKKPTSIAEWQDLMKKTDSLVIPGDNILFKIDIDI
jgi:hypothetical protein